MRNYINALVQFHDLDEPTEVIFKVGEVDLENDMHVFAHLKSEDEIETLKQNGHPQFEIIEYWKGIRPNPFPTPENTEDDWEDFFNSTGKYAPEL